MGFKLASFRIQGLLRDGRSEPIDIQLLELLSFPVSLKRPGKEVARNLRGWVASLQV